MNRQTLWMLCSIIMLLSQVLVLFVQHRHLETIRNTDDMPHSSFRRRHYAQHNAKHGRPKTVKHQVTNTGGSDLAAVRYQKTKRRLLVHLHIGKNGGSSVDRIGPSLARQTQRIYIPQGHTHFDWSFIEQLPPDKVDVITMLRNPIDRAVSQFYYSKTLPWTQKRPIGQMTLNNYLFDTTEMMHTRTIWADGQAATWWLTGTHVEPWVQVDPTDVERREAMYAVNGTAMCHLAADRLDSTLWFGLIEDLPRSMELLQHALQLDQRPILPKANRNAHPKPTEAEKEALASLMPRDLWVYEYGKRLFEARYQAIKTGESFVPPERPPIPNSWSCTSTKTSLDCKEGPYQGSFQLQVPPKKRIRVKQK